MPPTINPGTPGVPGAGPVRFGPADVGSRVSLRWRRPVDGGPAGADEPTELLGVLEFHDGVTLRVRRRDGELVEVPSARVQAGKVVPAAPVRRRREA